MKSLTLKIGGEAGEGIMAAGAILSRALVRAGLAIVTTNEYPSLVRGGHNTYIIRASEEKIFSLEKSINLLVALNKETIILHQNELTKEGGIIYDSQENLLHGFPFLSHLKLYPLPLLELALESGGTKLMKNNVALGASWAVIDLPLEILISVISDVFAKKDRKIIEQNIFVAKKGYDYIKKNFPSDFAYKLTKRESVDRLVLTGNEAIGLGAILSGLDFAALYPMTPINGLLHFFAANQEKGGFIYQQPEDEIAGINMAIGASYAGARALVATSGGGFSLMVEGYGMAAMTETPLVIILGTRPGPSTGLATWTGQADLKFVLSASQGDFLRVVLAPGDHEECFELTKVAFDLAEKYQTPVILLVDKFLCESIGTIDKFKVQSSKFKVNKEKIVLENGEYQRYKIINDGISPRALPGQTYFITNSYEHDEFGYSTEDQEVIKKMVEKRGKKYANLAKEVPEPQTYGEKGEIILVGWGSTKGPAQEAVKIWNNKNKNKISYLHLNWINPFPKEAVSKIFAKGQKIISIEGNYSGQMTGWIREQTGIETKDKILKYDGRPFYPEEIIEGISTILL